MTFLHPWALTLGAAAATLPVVIHFLTRPRPVPLPLSTIRFVREAVRQRRARHRLRDAIVLALRTLAVFAIAAAVARPLGGQQPIVTPGESGDAARVVILDVSQSLAAVSGGIQLFERARPVAASYLSDQPGLQANLVLAGASARPTFERLSTNFAVLREELGRAQCRPERLGVQAALNLAGELLAKTPAERRRELVIVSDFQRTNWAAADFSTLPQDCRIQLESVAPAESPPNLAVLQVDSQGRLEQGRDVRLEVEIGNFSPTPRQVQVEALLGGSAYRLQGLCPPGIKTTLTTDARPRGAGWQTGEVRLVDVQDALAADDTRPFVLEIRPPPTFALFTRQPAGLRPSSSYYLERALQPFVPRPGEEAGRVVRVDPANLERELLAAADVFVLDHPGRLSNEAIQTLATALRRGRSVLYIAAEAVDATNLRQLADAAGSELQLPVEFAPVAAGQRRQNLFLAEVRHDRPPFNVFGETVVPITAPLRFSGGLTSRRVDNALADDILATYSDRSACLVVTASGAGTLAVLNADLSASNLPTSAAFVPLVGELVDRLLSRPRRTDAACGEAVAVYLPTAAGPAAGLQLRAPETSFAAPAVGDLREESTGVLWRLPGPETPGVYQVQRNRSTVFALAAGIPADESDLRPLEAAVFQDRLAGGRALSYHAAAADDELRDDLWSWLAAGCVLLLLAELIALKAFRT